MSRPVRVDTFLDHESRTVAQPCRPVVLGAELATVVDRLQAFRRFALPVRAIGRLSRQNMDSERDKNGDCRAEQSLRASSEESSVTVHGSVASKLERAEGPGHNIMQKVRRVHEGG